MEQNINKMEQYINKDVILSEIGRILTEIFDGKSFDSFNKEQRALVWYLINLRSFVMNFKEVETKESALPEEKMKSYLNYCKDKKSSMVCDCGRVIEVQLVPYFYRESDNEVCFASICPYCGKLIITAE